MKEASGRRTRAGSSMKRFVAASASAGTGSVFDCSQAVTQATNDKHQLLPMITSIAQQAGDTPSQVLADAGYCSDDILKLYRLCT